MKNGRKHEIRKMKFLYQDMFRWMKNPPPEYGEVDHGGGDPCGGGHGGY